MKRVPSRAVVGALLVVLCAIIGVSWIGCGGDAGGGPDEDAATDSGAGDGAVVGEDGAADASIDRESDDAASADAADVTMMGDGSGSDASDDAMDASDASDAENATDAPDATDASDAAPDAPDAASDASADAADAAPDAPIVHAPDPPINVSAIGGDASATIAWSAPANNGGSPVTSYTVTSSLGDVLVVAGTVLSTPMVGLTPAVTYTFTVTATNAIGTSLPSSPSNAVLVVGPPQPPTGVVATRGDGAASVQWTAPANVGGSPLTGYTVTSSPGNLSVSVAGNVTSTVAPGLANGTAYTFTVTATNAVGTSAPSASSNSITPAGVPLPPTNVSASAGNGSATVSWTAPSANGSPITGYTVRSNPGAFMYAVAGGTTTTIASGLTNGVSYTFTVTATNSVGTSGSSSASNAVTPSTVPNAPTGLTLTPGAASISASWSAPANNGGSAIDLYAVYVGGMFNASTATTSINLSGLPTCSYPADTCGKSYSVTVYAHNANGYSSGLTGSAVPKVSYVTDNIRGIYTKNYGSGSCTGCHAAGHVPDLSTGSPVGYASSVSEASRMYLCPTGQCPGIMVGYNLFATNSAEYRTLVQWVTDGKLQ